MAAVPGDAGAPPRTRARTEQVPPTLLGNGIEVALHSVPRVFVKDLQAVLPDVDMTGLLIAPTCQKAAMDLVATGADVAAEKDRLLEKFNAWAEAVRALLAADGCWMDYVDPCSGLPVHTRNLHILYPEVDTMETLLRYRTEGAGPCKVLHHPRWGSACYPATAFVRAPGRDAQWVLAQMERAAAAGGGAAGRGGGGASTVDVASAPPAADAAGALGASASGAPSPGVGAAGGAAATAHATCGGSAARGASAGAAAESSASAGVAAASAPHSAAASSTTTPDAASTGAPAAPAAAPLASATLAAVEP